MSKFLDQLHTRGTGNRNIIRLPLTSRCIKHIEVVEEALEELLRVKEYKDTFGKTDEYKMLQENAWNQAKEAMDHMP